MKRYVGQQLFHKDLDGRQYPPEVLQAFILRKLAADARRQIGHFTKVVITVPAYFDEVRRKSTQDAGYIAGLDVIDIINEPTAAAVAYGFQQGFLNDQGQARQPQKVLVYDLGGGTFDVTIMQIAGDKFTTLATDGDVELGGRDWDNRLVDLAAEHFLQEHGLDPRNDPSAAMRLWRDCEDAKRTLSARSKALITCDFQGKSSRLEVTRDKFVEITADLLDRTRFTTRQTLQAAGLDWASIDRVLLVGGSSRMPMVRDLLRSLAGKEPEANVSADEAVAHGAALQASLLFAKGGAAGPKFRIKNVNSHSLGVIGADRQTNRKRIAVLIARNTALPIKARRTFKTQKAGQKSVLVQIVEGESPSPDGCVPIGRCAITDLPDSLPAHSPVIVEFQYAANGRLRVFVEVPATGHRARRKLCGSRASPRSAWTAGANGSTRPGATVNRIQGRRPAAPQLAARRCHVNRASNT